VRRVFEGEGATGGGRASRVSRVAALREGEEDGERLTRRAVEGRWVREV
jgi:hypothetical protein